MVERSVPQDVVPVPGRWMMNKAQFLGAGLGLGAALAYVLDPDRGAPAPRAGARHNDPCGPCHE